MLSSIISSILIASVACHKHTDFAGKAEVKSMSPSTYVNLGQLQYYKLNKIEKGYGRAHHRDIAVGPIYYTIPGTYFSSRFIEALPALSDVSLEQNVNAARLLPRAEGNVIRSGFRHHGSMAELGSPNVNISVDTLSNQNQGIAGKKTYLDRRADIIYDPSEFANFQAGSPDVNIAVSRLANTNQGVAFSKVM